MYLGALKVNYILQYPIMSVSIMNMILYFWLLQFRNAGLANGMAGEFTW